MSSNWESRELQIGKVREGKNVRIEVKVQRLASEIINIKSSCGCTKVKYDKYKAVLNILYKAGKIPNHIKDNEAVIRIMITVTYKEGNQDFLFINGTKIRY